jgi:putative transposase
MAGVPVHVIQRGHNRSACFFTAVDRIYYLEQLAAQAGRFGCAVHAYCLMTNHIHLLLTPASPEGCGRMMKHLAQRYAQHANRTYRRNGTLYEGRFRSCLVESERYLLTCCRYIELNPVRAGMVREPGDYPWSSNRANAEGAADPAVQPHECYLALGRDPAERCAAYRALCRQGLDAATLAAIRSATNGGFVLGAARFAEDIAGALGRRVTRGKAGRPAKPAAPA